MLHLPFRYAVLMDGDKEVTEFKVLKGATEVQHDKMRFRRNDWNPHFGMNDNPKTDDQGRTIFKRVDKEEEEWLQGKWWGLNHSPAESRAMYEKMYAPKKPKKKRKDKANGMDKKSTRSRKRK